MAVMNANAFYPASKARPYPFPATTGTGLTRIAETDGQYKTKIRGEEWSRKIKSIELRAQHTTASAQIGRLCHLTNLLLQPKPTGRPAAELERHTREIRQTANELEDILHAIVGPLVKETEPDNHDERKSGPRPTKNAPVSGRLYLSARKASRN